jgi:hypothetical protein
MKRPERIRVLGKRFDVKFAGDTILAQDLNGECDSDRQLILVREGQPLESEQDTVLHEILHAIDEAMGLKMKEAQVKGAATGLLAVMKDNPALVAYLKKKNAVSPTT